MLEQISAAQTGGLPMGGSMDGEDPVALAAKSSNSDVPTATNGSIMYGGKIQSFQEVTRQLKSETKSSERCALKNSKNWKCSQWCIITTCNYRKN